MTPEILGQKLAISYVNIFNAPDARGVNFTVEKFMERMLPTFIAQQIRLQHIAFDTPEDVTRAITAGVETAQGQLLPHL